MGSSKQPANTTSTTIQKVPEWAEQTGKDILEMGKTNAARPYQQYGGERVAPFTPEQEMAMQGVTQRALQGSGVINAGENALMNTIGGDYLSPYQRTQGMGQNVLQGTLRGGYLQPFSNTAMQGNNLMQRTMGGQFLNPQSNPYLSRMVDTAMNQTKGQLNSQFNRPGAFGSTAHQEVMARSLGDVANNMYGQNYANERQNMMSAMGGSSAGYENERARQLQAAGMGEQGYQSERGNQMNAIGQALPYGENDYRDWNALGTVGDTRRNYYNDLNNLNFENWTAEQNYPLTQQDILARSFGQATTGQGTAASTAPNPYRSNNTANYLGTGLTLGGLLSSYQ
jgi:hypothetical protein